MSRLGGETKNPIDLVADKSLVRVGRLGSPRSSLIGVSIVVVTGNVAFLILRDGGELPPMAWVVFGPFILAGLVIAGWRSEVLIDGEGRRAITWWGLPWPIGVHTRSLADHDRVVIDREEHEYEVNGQLRQEIIYPVRLEGGRNPFRIFEPNDLRKARHDAEAVARRLKLPLHDGSDGPEAVQIRPYASLDLPLIAALARESEDVPDPGSPPEGSGLAVRALPSGIEIGLPTAPKLSALFSYGLMILVGGAFGGLGLAPLFTPSEGGVHLDWAVNGSVLFLGGLVALLRASTSKQHLRLTLAAIEYERRWLFFRYDARIPLRFLEELRLTDAAGWSGRTRVVSARSDAAFVDFGHGLDETALDWLHRRLVFELVDLASSVEPPAEDEVVAEG
jgi:hypothetical protein